MTDPTEPREQVGRMNIGSFPDFAKIKLGVGCATLGGAYGSIADDNELTDIVTAAIDSGVPYFDTSPYYGDSEVLLGRALRRSGRPRDSYVVATKCGRVGVSGTAGTVDFSAAAVEESVRRSLKRLQLAKIDIIQVHDIDFGDTGKIVRECLPALDRLRKEGLISFIGITGYPLERFVSVLEQTAVQIDMVLSYGRLNLFDNTLLDLLPYFKNRGISVVNASPLGMGLLTPTGPPPWNGARSPGLLAAARAAATHCKAHGAVLPQVAMQYALQWADQGVLTLVGVRSRRDLDLNLATMHNPLPSAQFAALLRFCMECFGAVDEDGRSTALKLCESVSEQPPHNQPFPLNISAFAKPKSPALPHTRL